MRVCSCRCASPLHGLTRNSEGVGKILLDTHSLNSFKRALLPTATRLTTTTRISGRASATPGWTTSTAQGTSRVSWTAASPAGASRTASTGRTWACRAVSQGGGGVGWGGEGWGGAGRVGVGRGGEGWGGAGKVGLGHGGLQPRGGRGHVMP